MACCSGSAVASPLYRARQFFRGFRTTLAPVEIALVRARLTEAEQALFAGMHPRDRRHSVDLALRLGPEASGDLQTAALLHDIGKGSLRVSDRIAFVLLGAVGRGLRARFEAEDGGRFPRALWRLEHHARLGAARLEAVGTRPRVIALVAGHTGRHSDADEELARLVAADGET